MPALAFSFLAGILVVQQLQALPNSAWLWLIIAGAALAARLRFWPGVAALIGVCWTIIFAQARLDDRLPEHLAGQDVIIQGYIASLPEVEARHSRFNFKVEPALPGIPSMLRLTWYQPQPAIKAGQNWRLTVRLKPPHGNLNPGGFDYERWLFVEGVGGTGYVRQGEYLSAGKANLFLVWRQAIADRIGQLALNPDSIAIIKALTIGDGHSLSSEQWEVFRTTGTTHLMVISGSHVALIAGFIYFLAARVWARTPYYFCPPPVAGAVAAITGAFLYAALTGFAVPAQRAALMLAVGMAALIRQRHIRPYGALAAALLMVLIFDPLIVLSAGFWLSFMAVGLILFALAGRLAKPGVILGGIKVNWYTSLGLTPVLLYFFQQAPLISPLANLIAVPVIGFIIVPLLLIAVILLFILPGIGEIIFSAADFCFQGLWWLLKQLAEAPVSAVSQMQPGVWALLFSIVGIIILLAPKGMPSHWLGVVLMLPLFFTQAPAIPSGTYKLTLLDVGQGLSAVVQTAGHVLIYDTGGKYSESSDAGRSIIIPFLRNQGIPNIDALIISHGDNDHIGGAGSLIEQHPAKRVLTSVPELLAAYRPALCQAGQSWHWDEVKFTILSPRSDEFQSENDNSCVLQITSSHGTALLTGDIEAEAEQELVRAYGSQLKSDVLIAPHHGSGTSSSLGFIKQVNPKAILIPAGYRNQFNHPDPGVLKRYALMGKKWLLSADEGELEADFGPELKINSWRKTQGRYWNYKSAVENQSLPVPKPAH